MQFGYLSFNGSPRDAGPGSKRNLKGWNLSPFPFAKTCPNSIPFCILLKCLDSSYLLVLHFQLTHIYTYLKFLPLLIWMPIFHKYVGKGYRKEIIKLILPCVSHVHNAGQMELHLVNNAGVTLSQRISPKISSWWRIIGEIIWWCLVLLRDGVVEEWINSYSSYPYMLSIFSFPGWRTLNFFIPYTRFVPYLALTAHWSSLNLFQFCHTLFELSELSEIYCYQ